MTFFWIYDLSTWTMVLLFCSFFVGLTWFGTIFIRPFLRAFLRGQPAINDVVGYLLGAHGVYFGILLGLLALASYENYSASEDIVVTEATKLAALYRDVNTYPEPARAQLTGQLRAYTRYVIDGAWPLQRQGVIPRRGTELVTEFQRTLAAFEPTTPRLEILHAEALHQFNGFVEARRTRLHAVTTGIPPILWYVVLIGAGVQIALLYMLDMRLVPHLLLNGVIAFYLATLIALIAAMDNPFRGEVSVTPEPFELVYETLMAPPQPAAGTAPGPVPGAPAAPAPRPAS